MAGLEHSEYRSSLGCDFSYMTVARHGGPDEFAQQLYPALAALLARGGYPVVVAKGFRWTRESSSYWFEVWADRK